MAGLQEEDPKDMSKCRQMSPPPKPSRDKQERKHARLSVMMRVRQREREMGGWGVAVAEDADVQRGGEGGHDGRKYNNLLFGGRKLTHEHQSGALRGSPDGQ